MWNALPEASRVEASIATKSEPILYKTLYNKYEDVIQVCMRINTDERILLNYSITDNGYGSQYYLTQKELVHHTFWSGHGKTINTHKSILSISTVMQ